MSRIISISTLALAVMGAACGSLAGEPTTGERVYTSEMSGTVTGSQNIDPRDITCDGTTYVQLQLHGETGIAGQPLDIMLVLDRSGSMGGQPLLDLKNAAATFVDIIDESTDGALDGVIANGSRVGVISFAGDVTVAQSLTSNAVDVKNAILALSAGGLTNHADAFATTEAQLSGSGNGKIAIMMTDGQTTVGGDATDEADDARNAGIEIFAIGLGSVDQPEIESWVSSPVAEHAFFVASSSELQAIFEAIGAAVTVPAATDITVVVEVDDHYAINGQLVTKGALATTGNTLTWTIDELLTETVTLIYAASHDPTQPGGVESVHVVSYSDAQGRTLSQADFGDATIRVHGCAAELRLTPETATNTVGDAHTVTATVLDDFGVPVSGVAIQFAVTGGLSAIDGEPSDPDPAAGSDTADDNGEATFTYSNTEASPDTITAIVPGQANVSAQLEATADKTWQAIEVAIDIKPGSYPNSYGASSRGRIPVALLGSAAIDVYQADDATVRFGDAPDAQGDAPIAHRNGHFEAVNGDDYMDKVYHFYFPDTHLDPGDSHGCMTGELGGLDFLGCDTVNIVP